MAFTFVHAADLHLDCPFSGIGEIIPELADTLNKATFTAWDRIVEACIKTNASFLLIAGDIFNAKNSSLRAQLKFREGLAKLAEEGIPSYIVHGNHDPADCRSHSITWPDEAVFFSCKTAETYDIVKNSRLIARVNGISYPKPDVRENLSARFKRQDGSVFSIGLLHCSCGQSAGHEPYSSCTKDDLSKLDYDYWALGHIHTKSLLKDTDPVIVYPGNPQGLNPKETGPKGCYAVNVNDSGQVAGLRFIETDVVRWFREQVSIDGMTRIEEVIDAIRESIENIRKTAGRPSLVRFELVGRGDVHSSLAKAETIADILNSLREWESMDEDFVWAESIITATRPAVDLEERRKAEDFVGDFLRAIEETRRDPDIVNSLAPVLKGLFESSKARKYLPQPTEEQIRAWLDAAEIYAFDALTPEGE